MSEPSFDPNTPPNPGGGWSEQITYLRDAVAVPASKGAFIQPAGILGNDGLGLVFRTFLFAAATISRHLVKDGFYLRLEDGFLSG